MNFQGTLLSKVLSFTPVQQPDIQKTIFEIEGFIRRLRLKEYFLDKQPDPNEPNLIHVLSEWTPDSERDGELDLLIENIENINIHIFAE